MRVHKIANYLPGEGDEARQNSQSGVGACGRTVGAMISLGHVIWLGVAFILPLSLFVHWRWKVRRVVNVSSDASDEVDAVADDDNIKPAGGGRRPRVSPARPRVSPVRRETQTASAGPVSSLRNRSTTKAKPPTPSLPAVAAVAASPEMSALTPAASDEAPVAEPAEPAEPPTEMSEPEAEPASVEEPTMNEAAPTASTNAEQAAAAAEAAAASTPPNQPIARPIARRGLGGSSGGGGGGRARRLAFGTPDAAANGQQGAVRRAARPAPPLQTARPAPVQQLQKKPVDNEALLQQVQSVLHGWRRDAHATPAPQEEEEEVSVMQAADEEEEERRAAAERAARDDLTRLSEQDTDDVFAF